MSTQDQIIDLEHEALQGWSTGQPVLYLVHADDSIRYCDNLQAAGGVSGIEAVRGYFKQVYEPVLKAHKYEMVNPVVNVNDKSAVLSFIYDPSTLEGEPLTQWSATVVYHKIDDQWKVVHGHWTMLPKQEQV